MIDLNPIWLSLKLAFVSSLLLFLIGIPIAYWLAFSKNKIRSFIETLVSMPLVLPPTVLGFYFLFFFSPDKFPASILKEFFGINVLFSFQGLVFASVIYSMPFMINPIRSGFAGMDKSIIEASWVLGKSKLNTLLYVIIPNSKNSIITAIAMAFAHTLGEFGLVLMIGGNIPDKTRVASIAIYDSVEALDYNSANIYSLVIIVIAFLILFGINQFNKRIL